MKVVVSAPEVELALRMCQAVWLIDGHTLRTGSPEELIETATGSVFETAVAHFDTERRTFAVRPPAGPAME